MIGGIVLAAGASTRAGMVKALATIDGETLVERAIRVLREGGAGEIVVVVGPPHAEVIAAVIGDAKRADNPDPARGMLSSLRCALSDRGPSDGWEAALVSLVDHPRVSPSTVRALIDAWRERGAEVVRPRHAGRCGHPYLVACSVFHALREGGDAEGARPILAAHRREDVDIDDPFVHDDLDTAEQLAALRGGS